jgi:hypothetical protein
MAERLEQDLDQKPRVMRVDSHDVVSKRPAAFTGAWIFERDEYVFYDYQISLESTRGDL